ncbi:condensation domain-containing protein, partial [Herbaspirillum rubrisubalbicans]
VAPEHEAFIAPAGPTETAIATIWQDVLGVPQVGASDNFFALGGHSLLATQVASRLEHQLGRRIALRSLFESRNLRALAQQIERRQDRAPQVLIPALGQSSGPLSLAQSRLWFLWQLAPDGAASATYHIPMGMELRGALDLPALQRSLDALAARHAILRTVLRDTPQGLQQQVLPVAPALLAHIDLTQLPPPQAQLQATQVIAQHAQQPFDLRAGPPMRLALLRLPQQRHVLLLCLHHILADAWSMRVLLREFRQLYEGTAVLPALPIQYLDYASWQTQWLASGEGARQLAYWKQALGQQQPLLQLPGERPRPPQPSHRGARIRRSLTMAPAVQALGRARQATPFMVLLASLQLLLYRLSGQQDVRVGVPVANRHHLQTEGLVGCFVNTQVLRAQLRSDMDSLQLLEQVRETVLLAQAHQDLPFEQLVEALQPERSLNHTPLFQVMFNHERLDADERMPIAGLTVEAVRRDSHLAKFDLDVAVIEDARGGMELMLTYATDLFDATTIDRMADQWLLLLEGMVADPTARISDLPLQDATTRQALLQDWNPQQLDHPEQACLHTLIEAQAAHRPHAMAVDQLSYDQLNRRANRLAHRLIQLGAGPERLVGVAMERGPDLIITLLAVLKAGAAYLPLDPV